MTANDLLPTRREAILAALATAAVASLASGVRAAEPSRPAGGRPGDWDWLVGSWKVRHRRLKERLAGNDDWEAFAGTCVNWPILGGGGNIDDNLLELPAGSYRGVGVRALNPDTGQWSIWWLDSRMGRIDPPVVGGFRDGVGSFIGDDVFRERPIKVRFRWLDITAASARWEQAFSPDGGATWEVNWQMWFTRA